LVHCCRRIGESGVSGYEGEAGIKCLLSPAVTSAVVSYSTCSVQQYFNETADPGRYRPDHCPQCKADRPLTGHGFYSRTLVDAEFDGSTPVLYLCRCCKRTVSLLPEFALPYLRFSITVIALFLIARLLGGSTLSTAAFAAMRPGMPYQRGQYWVRRFRSQAERLCAALAVLIAHLQRRTSFPWPCASCSPSAGSPPTGFCLPICDSTCWAGQRFSLQTGD
jgi:hypothetical protein